MSSDRACLLKGGFKQGFGKVTSPYKRLLVAIDNSYASAKVFERALLISRDGCILLYAVNVIQTNLPYSKKSSIAIDDDYREILNKTSNDLFETALKKGKEAGVNVEPVQLEGDPAEEILKFALDNDVELIIVGSKEKVGSTKNLGSVSARIATEAKCSVLIER